MPQQDIIVVGASAGGVEALQQLVRGIPANIPAAIFVAIHLYPRSKSFLPAILSRAGELTALHPVDGQRVENGLIYVGPPDYHLVIEHDHIHLGTGPKEQHQRPCINVMFRSAAQVYGERVAGVVLTGQMDDGTAGLFEIKRRGGIAIVQNPEEALFSSMPLSALREIAADYTLPLNEIGPLLHRLATGGAEPKQIETAGTDVQPALTDLTCPDCRGTIWEVPCGNGTEYRCRVGHAYSAKSMLSEHFAAQEKALYAAMVALEEGASLATRLAQTSSPELRDRLQDEAREREAHALVVKKVLRERQSFSLE